MLKITYDVDAGTEETTDFNGLWLTTTKTTKTNHVTREIEESELDSFKSRFSNIKIHA